MIKPDISYVKDLHEFYSKLVEEQQSAHGELYTAHHKALTRCAKECETIKEIGVCQGGTLAAMLLTNPKKLVGVDIAPRYFKPYQKHFETYAKENDVDFSYNVISSIDVKSVSEVDMIHIDSLHTPEHLTQELKLHAPHVKKYMVFHDTSQTRFGLDDDSLYRVIEKFCKESKEWEVIEREIRNVGYTVIKRNR